MWEQHLSENRELEELVTLTKDCGVRGIAGSRKCNWEEEGKEGERRWKNGAVPAGSAVEAKRESFVWGQKEEKVVVKSFGMQKSWTDLTSYSLEQTVEGVLWSAVSGICPISFLRKNSLSLVVLAASFVNHLGVWLQSLLISFSTWLNILNS